MFVQELGPEHHFVALVLGELGPLLATTGDARRAEAVLRAAISHAEADPPTGLARRPRFVLAQLLLDEYGNAAASEVRELLEPIVALEPDPPTLALVRLELAELALAEQRHDDAAQLLELAEPSLVGPDRLRLRLALAQLARARGEDVRARLAALADALEQDDSALEPAERAKLELRLASMLAGSPSPTRDELARARSLGERGRIDLVAAHRALGAWRAMLARR